jgi:NADPH-dependent F420 reductase
MTRPLDATNRPCVALLGGTGKQGRALTRRLARAGYPVIIGTRSPDKGARICAGINDALGRDSVRSDTYLAATIAARIVVLCVPYAAQRQIAEEVRHGLGGKILIDTTVALLRREREVVYDADSGSAVASLQALLGESVKVVAAFQNVSAHLLDSPADRVDGDVLVCGDDETARDAVIALIADIGLHGIHAGPIRNAAAAESLTPVLMWINGRAGSRSAAIKIIVPGPPQSQE